MSPDEIIVITYNKKDTTRWLKVVHLKTELAEEIEIGTGKCPHIEKDKLIKRLRDKINDKS